MAEPKSALFAFQDDDTLNASDPFVSGPRPTRPVRPPPSRQPFSDAPAFESSRAPKPFSDVPAAKTARPSLRESMIEVLESTFSPDFQHTRESLSSARLAAGRIFEQRLKAFNDANAPQKQFNPFSVARAEELRANRDVRREGVEAQTEQRRGSAAVSEARVPLLEAQTTTEQGRPDRERRRVEDRETRTRDVLRSGRERRLSNRLDREFREKAQRFRRDQGTRRLDLQEQGLEVRQRSAETTKKTALENLVLKNVRAFEDSDELALIAQEIVEGGGFFDLDDDDPRVLAARANAVAQEERRIRSRLGLLFQDEKFNILAASMKERGPDGSFLASDDDLVDMIGDPEADPEERELALTELEERSSGL